MKVIKLEIQPYFYLCIVHLGVAKSFIFFYQPINIIYPTVLILYSTIVKIHLLPRTVAIFQYNHKAFKM